MQGVIIFSTSLHIGDLARLSPEEIDSVRRLPGGAKSYKAAVDAALELYLLFRYRNRLYPGLFDRLGDVIIDSEKMDGIMRIIRSERDERPCLFTMDPHDADVMLQ